MRAALKRYQLFGWDYEAIAPQDPAEIGWHLTWATRTGGPVLVLACGTGRLVCHLAELGFDTVGIDLSDTMLKQARRHARERQPSTRRRIRFVRADASDFHFDDRFGMIAIPDNSFRELGTRENMRRCLRRIRDHLTATGALLVTERRFNPAEFPQVRDWAKGLINPVTGERVARRLELQLSHSGQRISGRFQYRTVHPDGSETVTDCPISQPAVTKKEYLRLFRTAGFDAGVFVGYSDREDDGECPILCFVCTPQRRGRGDR